MSCIQAEVRAKEEAEARLATLEARIAALEAEKVAEAEKHNRDMRTLESNLNAAHAGKQVSTQQQVHIACSRKLRLVLTCDMKSNCKFCLPAFNFD